MSKLKILSTDTDEEKNMKTALITARDEAIDKATELIKAAVDPTSAEFKTAIEGVLKSAFGNLTIKLGDTEMVVQKGFEALQEEFNQLALKMQDGEATGKGKLTFAKSMGKAIDLAKDKLAVFQKGATKDEVKIELKDMSFDDFSGTSYDTYTTDHRQDVFVQPFAPIWLRNLFPSATTEKGAIFYLRANGSTGAAAIWDGRADGPPDKASVEFLFQSVTETVEWIAAIVRIPREMLDDAAFLRTFIPNRLMYGPTGIMVAENNYIFDKLTDSANSVAYNGTKTLAVEKIYDAALGQLRDNYYNPSYILMNNRDMVNLIALNKASTSGIYDLPPGMMIVINGNQLYIGGLPVIGIPQFGSGEFVVFDSRAIQFVSRLSPEVRAFEQDRDNVIKNLITFRAEERVCLLIFDKNAVIRGTISS